MENQGFAKNVPFHQCMRRIEMRFCLDPFKQHGHEVQSCEFMLDSRWANLSVICKFKITKMHVVLNSFGSISSIIDFTTRTLCQSEVIVIVCGLS